MSRGIRFFPAALSREPATDWDSTQRSSSLARHSITIRSRSLLHEAKMCPRAERPRPGRLVGCRCKINLRNVANDDASGKEKSASQSSTSNSLSSAAIKSALQLGSRYRLIGEIIVLNDRS